MSRVPVALEASALESEALDGLDQEPVVPEPNRPPGWIEVRDVADVATQVIAAGPRSFLVRSLIVAGSYGVLGAPYKAGKTYDILDMAVSIATGTRWLEHFECPSPGPVLAYLGEGDRSGIVRRLDAIVRSRGGTMGDLTGMLRLAFRVPRFTRKEQVEGVARELAEHPASAVFIDPAYIAGAGAKSASLFDMGEALAPIQETCQEARTTLGVVWHWNQTGQGHGAGRFTGAGAAEWGRFLGSAEVRNRVVRDGWSEITTRFEFTGSEIPDAAFGVIRRIRALDPDDPDSRLEYRVEVHEDQPASPADALSFTERRILTTLEEVEPPGITRQEIGDRLAGDGTGRPLKRQTIDEGLNALSAAGLVDADRPGIGKPNRWWRT